MLSKLIKTHQFIDDNWEIHFYKNGQIHEIYQLRNNVRHGHEVNFFDTGDISYIVSYKNNKKHGSIISLWKWNDNLRYIWSNFKKDILHGVSFNEGHMKFMSNGRRVL